MHGLRIPALVAIGGVLLLVLVSSIVPAGSGAVDSTSFAPSKSDRLDSPWYLDGPSKPEEIMAKEPGFTAGAIAPMSQVDRDKPKKLSLKRTASVDLRPMLFFFQRQLKLSAEQLRHFRRVLGERDVAVQGLQDEITDSGRFEEQYCRARIEDIKAIYYEKMGRCLGPLQHQEFVEILAEGRFGDAVVIELPSDP